MRELPIWIFYGLAGAVLGLILWFMPPAHAEPAGTFPTACMSSARLTAMLEELGAKTWSIEGLRAVRFLSIVNHIDPPTDYRAESVIAVFPPSGEIMGAYLVNGGCAGKERISLPVKTAIAAMRETFDRGDVKVMLIHDIYTGVRGKSGQICCGGTDCNRVEYRMTADGAEFLVGGDPWGTPKEWVAIPNEEITFLPVPGDVTGDAHFCGRPARDYDLPNGPHMHGRYYVYCAFIPPGGS